jgi:plasmid stabilization system protein ParE
MTFCIKILRRGSADIDQITAYIHQRSPQGASAWLNALQRAIKRLEQNAESCGEADENQRFDIALKQALFRTRRGRVYRIVFTIAEHEVRILRIRGPGQAPIEPGDV